MKKQAFLPVKLPIEIDDKDKLDLLSLEINAIRKIERFNTIIERSPIKKELLIMFSLKESVESTKIEGTQATLAEVVEADAIGIANPDIREVKNYQLALEKAERLLDDIPISTRMFHELHKTLLIGSRGENRDPGNYRTVQNFIGPTKDTKDATYIPPEPIHINEYMNNLEKYINGVYENDNLGPLSRAAIIHGQFETIHPYLDGNGRLGRILIILYLLKEGIILEPNFFVSEELEKNKFKYYKLLNDLRFEKPEWTSWIKFFIQSSGNQAENYINKLISVEKLYDSTMEIAIKNNIMPQAVNFIFGNPIYNRGQMRDALLISYNTASRYTGIFESEGILYGGDQLRNKSYYNYNLLDIL